ncbi:Choline-sulfatase [Pirellulimonas nuda]|uniref:Choline-sulfatase n=1 Tax=Pirellulimonas nuda TaxID=2528009 RepID=A0A518DHK0_9BACT|nr:sulfatase-like hydrolase/transferase [Pirellulimonas nuda]QDU90944.1 Choline-sulfatase [Pirellulimonas nuda]
MIETRYTSLLSPHRPTARCLGVVLLLSACASANAKEPARADFSKAPGVVIDHVPASAGVYIGSPSLVVLPSGEYIASHDEFGPKSSEHSRAVTRIFRSTDRGETWAPIGKVDGQFWSTLFYNQKALYLGGAWKHHGNLIIRRSDDGGVTWTEPTDAATGLLAEGQYHCAPQPVVVHEGRIWRGMEDAGGSNTWGERYRPFMMSAPIDADLLSRQSWTFSNYLPIDKGWIDGKMRGWLEGNAVVAPNGQIVNILRVAATGVGGVGALMRVSDDGKTISFDPQEGFIEFPGGAKKFTIRHDPVSGRYWSLVNWVAPEDEGKREPGGIRNTLALTSSVDLLDWKIERVVVRDPDLEHGYQYPDWQFDGDDLIAVVRTATDDGLGGAHNYHDANFLTFHRLEGFRDPPVDNRPQGQPPQEQGADARLRPRTGGATPRNVLFIIADDLSCELGCYGAAGVLTPNLDRLAARGRTFLNAYCQSALCNPSRASLMTGLRPHELGVWTNSPHFRETSPGVVTLPQCFQSHGRHAVGIGKVYHNYGQRLHGDAASWSEPQVNHWGAHFHDWFVPGRGSVLHGDWAKAEAVQRADVPDDAYIDGRSASLATQKLRELKQVGQPFFMAVGFWKPHLPFNAPKKYWDLYDQNNLPPPPSDGPPSAAPAIALHNSQEARSYTDVPDRGPIPAGKQRELRHAYLAAISYVDAQVGRVLDELDRLGIAEDTVVAFCSDHGYHAGDMGLYGKLTNFESGTRTPLIIAAPGMAAPASKTSAICELLDLYPTLVEVCGLPVPAGLSGRSLCPVLDDPEATVKPYALSQITRPVYVEKAVDAIGSSLRTTRYRYTRWSQGADGSARVPGPVIDEELYDVRRDPGFAQNVAGQAAYAEMLGEARSRLAGCFAGGAAPRAPAVNGAGVSN